VIDSLVGEFDPKELTSEYRQNLRQMLESKLTGGQVVAKPEPVAETPVVDLMEALKRSVEEVKGGKAAGKAKTAAKNGSRKRVAARKSA
jgi:non-homologous end joining protein Ku